MGINQDALLTIFLTGAIAALLLRLEPEELQFAPLVIALVHVWFERLGPRWSRTRRTRGTC